MEKNYKYLAYFFLLLIPLTIAGFFNTYFGLIPDFNENITFWYHVHAAIASLWIIMLIIQPFLIRFKKVRFHKSIGKFSYALFPLLILSFVPTSFSMIDRFGVESVFFPVMLSMLLIIFYSQAIIHRKQTAIHMRYMIATAIVFIDPTLNRIWSNIFFLAEGIRDHITFGVQYSILFGLIFLDWSNNRNFKPYAVALVCFIIYHIIYYFIFG